MKRFYIMLVALGAFGLVFSGCKKEEEGGGDKPEAAKPADGDKKEEAKKEEPKKEEPKKEEAAAGGDSIGIPECDTYINKYSACVDEKVPEASRQAMKDAFAKTRDAWKQAASTEAGKKALAQACTQAMDAAKKAMEQFGCSWE